MLIKWFHQMCFSQLIPSKAFEKFWEGIKLFRLSLSRAQRKGTFNATFSAIAWAPDSLRLWQRLISLCRSLSLRFARDFELRFTCTFLGGSMWIKILRETWPEFVGKHVSQNLWGNMWHDFVLRDTCFISTISFFAWHSSSSSFPWASLLIGGLRLKLQLHIFHLLRMEQHGLFLQVVASVLQLLLLSACLVLSLHQAVSHLNIFCYIRLFCTWFLKKTLVGCFHLDVDNIVFGCFDLRVQSISVVWRLRHFLMEIVNRVDQPA